MVWQTTLMFQPRVFRAFTLIELLVVLAVLGVLVAIAAPMASQARARSKEVTCAANMRSLGQGLTSYASSEGGCFPYNVSTWRSASISTRWNHVSADRYEWSWVGLISMYVSHGSPWLEPLRCPNARMIHGRDEYSAGAFVPLEPGEPASCWYLNSYACARDLSAIPCPSEGVLALEVGVWDRRSADTGALENASRGWAYPHPNLNEEYLDLNVRPWAWLPPAGKRPRRHILWCDGHVTASEAKTWPTGDQVWDKARIRYMTFGLGEP